MPRKLDRPSTKHPILIYDEDWLYLQSRFGEGSLVNTGVSQIIREMVHRFVRRQRQEETDLEDAASAEGAEALRYSYSTDEKVEI